MGGALNPGYDRSTRKTLMGGQPTTVQNSQSVSQPWKAAQPDLQGILSSLQPLTHNAALTPVEQSALGGLTANAQAGNPYAPAIGGVANNLLLGGGANAQAGALGSNLANYQSGLAPFTNPSFLNPYNTPGFGDALHTLNSDITNQVNGMFAGAGRDLSGQNVQTLARGLSQGEGGLIANQYNQNVGNQLGAMGASYGAGNTTGGLLANLNQLGVGNQQAGIAAAQQALGAQNYGPNQLLAIQQMQRGIPTDYLRSLTGIAAPIAGLGSQSNGTATTTTQVPLANQVAGGLLGGLGLLGNLGGFGANGWLYGGGKALL